MSVVPKTQKLQVHTAKRLDQLFISRTLCLTVRLHSIRQVCFLRIDIHLIKQILMHEIIIALIVRTRKSLVLIQVHRIHLRKIQISRLILLDKILICSDRRRTCCKPQHAIWFQDDL